MFTDIYLSNRWGGVPETLFSGDGSHNQQIVFPYVNALSWFLSRFSQKPTVFDLGCGDFNVGSQLRSLCNKYVAADIVDCVIEENKKRFDALGVEFMVLNGVTDELPKADVCIVRQVFQHLGNKEILQIVPKLKAYKFLIFTDHLPATVRYQPNIDIEPGIYTRLMKKSGVELTSYPFNLNPVHEWLLCATPAEGGIIKTTGYQLY